METKAKLRYLRMSPRKVRLVVDLVRGMEVGAAVKQLKFSSKRAALPVLKLINSAVANAENNFKLKKDNLFIKEIKVDQGPALKRWRARAMGRAASIKKFTSHVTVVLAEIKPTDNQSRSAKQSGDKSGGRDKAKNDKVKVVKDLKDIKKDNKIKRNTSSGGKNEQAASAQQPEAKKKVFNRKAV